MSRRTRSNSMASLSIPTLNQLISNNAQLFRESNTLSGTVIRDFFQIVPITDQSSPAAVRTHDFAMFSAYARLNKLLRRRGLVLKKDKDTYKVLGHVPATQKAAAYVREAGRNIRQHTTLTEGIRLQGSLWSPLTTPEMQDINN